MRPFIHNIAVICQQTTTPNDAYSTLITNDNFMYVSNIFGVNV
jgi:hypothetical protein